MPRFRPLVPLFLLVALGGCQTWRGSAPQAVMPPVSASALHAVLHEADRVEISRPGEPPFARRTGEGIGREFLAQVPLELGAGPFRCDCGPRHRLAFFAGDRLVAELHVHGAHHVRWDSRDWNSDVPLQGGRGQAYLAWLRTAGGTILDLRGEPGSPVNPRDKLNDAFLACFPPAARDLARWQGAITRTDLAPWREAGNLRALMPDAVAMATAAFRAFGVQPAPWHEDDYRTAVIQTAVETLSNAELLAALQGSESDAQALRGAARIFLRLGLFRRFDSAANGRWLPLLADAQLRGGRALDQPMMLIQLAATGEPAAKRFLRGVATGR